MARQAVTVTALNNYINRVLKSDPYLSNIKVIGEITGLKYHSSGHVYFSIVDKESKISCFLPKSLKDSMSFILKDGMEVVISGFINVYERGGTYSIFVKEIKPEGEGSLAMAFEAIKQKLADEGLFAPEKKKEIPKFPKNIGIITSETGAAIEDILKTIKKKNDKVNIVLFPALVQGQYAAVDIAEKIAIACNYQPQLDVLIVGRGGGSAEDLWPFNEEVVAKAIYNADVPIISSVGHEIDFTISDLVADVRAATPTAAAEIAAYDSFALAENLEGLKNTLLDRLISKSQLAASKLELTYKLINMEIDSKLQSLNHRVEKSRINLEENNPSGIFNKGYGAALDKNGGIIDSVAKLNLNDEIILKLKDGSAKCKVLEKLQGGRNNDL